MKRTEVEIHSGMDIDVLPRRTAMLVQLASSHASKIYLEKNSRKVNAKSIMGMMSLSLNGGEMITVTAEGEDEADALDDIVQFLMQ